MDVNLKVGIDGGAELKSLQDLRKGLSDLHEGNVQLQKDIKDRAEASISADSKMISSIVNSNKQLQEQKTLVNELKAAVEAAAKSGKSGIDSYNASLKDSGELIKTLAANASKGLLSPAETKKLIDALKNTKNEFEALNVIIDTTKKRLATMNPDSAEFKQLTSEVQQAEIMLKAFADETGDATEKQKSLKAELREMTAQLAQLKAEGKENTAEYEALKNKAGELFDTISDARDEIRQAGSDTQGFDKLIRVAQTVTGSFQIAQGAAALFGQENEDVQKALLKVNAAMSILNGLQAIQNELTKADSIYKGIATVVQKTWNWAINEGTVSLRVFKVALLGTGIGAIIVALGFAFEAMQNFSNATDEAADKQKRLGEEAERTNKIIDENADAVLKQRDAGIDGLDILKRQLDLAEKRGASEKVIADLKTQIVNKEISDLNFLKGYYAGNADKLDEINRKLRDKENERLGIKLELEKKTGDKIKEQSKKNAEEEKKLAADVAKFYQQAADDKVAAIADANERARVENINAFEKEVANVQDAYDKIVATQKLSSDKRKELDDAYHKQLNDISAKYAIKAVEIETKQQEDLLKIRKDVSDAVSVIYGTEKEQEIQQIKDKYDALRETLKKNGELFSSDEAAITAKRKKEIQAVTDKYDLAALDKQEEIAIANTEATTKNETEKQKKVLAIQLDYAKKKLALLEATGGEENAVQIAQLKKLIADLSKEIKTSNSNTSLNSIIAQVLGITEDDLKKVEDNVRAAVTSILSVLQDDLNKRIELKQKEIDAENKRIDDLESSLEKEKDLQKRGYANNVEEKKKELAALKAQRDKDIADQKEAQKRLQEIEIAKQSAALATSVANLIVTTTQIIKSFSEQFGWVGAIAGIAEAGVVIAEFAALRNSIKQYQTLGDGGEVSGKPHTGGGNKYISMDRNDPAIVEIEDGEWLTNKKQTQKYKPLLEAINKDELSSWTYRDLLNFVQPSDIKYNDSQAKKLIVDQQELVSTELHVHGNGNSDAYLKEIASTNKELVDIEKNRSVKERDGNDLVITSGNKITRIKNYYKKGSDA